MANTMPNPGCARNEAAAHSGVRFIQYMEKKMYNAISAISDFIFLEDAIRKADIILVPGGSKPELMYMACELYKSGYAPLILPSGGANEQLENHETEWDYFLDISKNYDIPESSILIEKEAKNTFENARFSKKVINENEIEIKTALLVCKAFHARRALMTYQTEFDSHINYIIVPVIDDRDIKKDNWYLDEVKYKKVMNEVEKIGKYFSTYMKALIDIPNNHDIKDDIVMVEIGKAFIGITKKLMKIKSIREKFNKKYGLNLKGIRIKENAALSDSSFCIKINGKQVCKSECTNINHIIKEVDRTLNYYKDVIKQSIDNGRI
jgi:uncharacterized SAM-binding protein YcdF (DUF218 family)